VHFAAFYQDKFGVETTVIQNDGKNLRMVIRGIEFNGFMFDDFEPNVTDETLLASFLLNRGTLCSCRISCDIPVAVVVLETIIECVLNAQIELGDPKSNGGIDREQIRLTLQLDDQVFQSSGAKGGWFDDELQEIQTVLPDGVYIKSCYTCAFSDYNPAGYGAFGCMACFRNNKQEYLNIRGKTEFLIFFSKKTENVQETWLCSEYEKRIPGTGYRG
jgi:hypothetical protein